MEVIDTNDKGQNEEKLRFEFKRTVFKFAAIGSAVLIGLRLFEFLILPNLELESILTIFAGITLILNYIIVLILSVKFFKKNNEGFITLKQGFCVSFVTGCIMAFFDMLISLILILSIYDSSALGDFESSFNLTESDFSAYLDVVLSFLESFILGCLVGAIVAWIISLVLKKQRPKEIYSD